MSGPINPSDLSEAVARSIRKSRLPKPPAQKVNYESYESVKSRSGGSPVYALAVDVRCPWEKCGAQYLLTRFCTRKQGINIFFRCHKCGECFITLRNVKRTYGTNTYPVDLVKAAWNKRPALFETWMNKIYAMWEWIKAFQEKSVTPYKEHVFDNLPGGRVGMRSSFESPEETREYLTRKEAKDWGYRS